MKLIYDAQYEISIDGVPRSYCDRKDLALQGAQYLKARNPNSVVKRSSVIAFVRWATKQDQPRRAMVHMSDRDLAFRRLCRYAT